MDKEIELLEKCNHVLESFLEEKNMPDGNLLNVITQIRCNCETINFIKRNKMENDNASTKPKEE